jgi:midasin
MAGSLYFIRVFSVLLEFLRKHYFANGPLTFLLTSPSLTDIESRRLHRLLLAYYRILVANPQLPQHFLWPLSPLSKLFWTPHSDTGVRLLAIRCYAIQSGMSEAEREKLETEILGKICGVDCPIEYGHDIYGNSRSIDGWVLPALELKRVFDARNALISDVQDYYTIDPGDVYHPISQSDLGQVRFIFCSTVGFNTFF